MSRKTLILEPNTENKLGNRIKAETTAKYFAALDK